MRVLVLDNYDSFTYNLVQYLGELGAEIEVVRNDHATVDELLVRGYDRVIVSAGPCTPHEAGVLLGWGAGVGRGGQPPGTRSAQRRPDSSGRPGRSSAAGASRWRWGATTR